MTEVVARKIGEALRVGTDQHGHPVTAAIRPQDPVGLADPMGQSCPGWRGDLAACLLGALDPQARAAVRRHLRTCPACQAEYDDLVPVMGRLALLSPRAAAPARRRR